MDVTFYGNINPSCFSMDIPSPFKRDIGPQGYRISSYIFILCAKPLDDYNEI